MLTRQARAKFLLRRGVGDKHVEGLMTRLRSLAISGAAAAAMMAGAVSQSYALIPGSFDNRLNGGTIGVPLGAAAPPGVYSGLGTLYTPGFYGAGTRAGGSGLNFPSVGSAVPVLWSTGYNFLGAAYSMAAVQPFYAAGTLPQGGAGCAACSSWSPEIANTIWTPIALSWNLGQGFFTSVGFNFMGPDGSRWVSSGNTDTNPDYWTFEPTLAFAYLTKSWALSLNLFYDINTKSAGTCCALLPGYTSGNELYGDWATLYQWGKWSFGPVGYFKFQTTADTGCAPALCSYNSAVAFGGLVGYDFGPVSFQVWVTDAVYQKNDIDGFAVWNRLSFRVWAPEAPKPLVAKN
jgi:hypothetical protein